MSQSDIASYIRSEAATFPFEPVEPIDPFVQIPQTLKFESRD